MPPQLTKKIIDNMLNTNIRLNTSHTIQVIVFISFFYSLSAIKILFLHYMNNRYCCDTNNFTFMNEFRQKFKYEFLSYIFINTRFDILMQIYNIFIFLN